MELSSDPPDPSEFPRARLLWPLALPALIAGVVFAGELGGHTWNVHGDGIILVAAFALSFIVGVLYLLFMLPQAVRELLRHPSLRAPMNLAVTGLASLFMVFAVYYFFFSSWWGAGP